jgi:hypothetical protein
MRILAVACSLALASGCSGSGSSPGPRPSIESFAADPPALYPGETVLLTAVFSGGAGTIEPYIGRVESGQPLALKPGTTPARYVLTVTDGTRTVVAELALAVAYRHRLDSIPGAIPRADHAAALLEDGRVLLAGGFFGAGWEGRTELWDPASRRFDLAGELDIPHAEATTLLDAKGRVLVTGGLDAIGELGSALVHSFDPTTGSWTRLHDLAEERHLHTATLLPNGSILLAGGSFLGRRPGTVATEEIYDPGGERPRAPAGGGMLFPRYGHTATRLPDGKVLFAGGRHAFDDRIVPAAELFDPDTETFAPAGNMAEGRVLHVAAPLPDGRVLLAGGDTSTRYSTQTAEIYDPSDRTFTPTGSLLRGRAFHVAVALSSGEVLVAGGMAESGELPAEIEVYSPDAGRFAPSPSSLPSGRTGLALVRLPDGSVLVHGGRTYSGDADGAAGLYR